MKTRILTIMLALWSAAAHAQPSPGEIKLPLDEYRQLEARLRELEARASTAPIEAAVASANVSLAVDDSGATITADLEVEVLGQDWIAVPLLPSGTALESATADGTSLALVARGPDLVWVTKATGRHAVQLRYRIARAPSASALDVPLPPAAASTLAANVPTADPSPVMVVPGEIVERSTNGTSSDIRATLPRASWARISWGTADRSRWLVTSASYVGTARTPKDVTIRWDAKIELDVATDELVTVPVAKTSVAIVEAKVGTEPAVLEASGDTLYVRVRGRGRHTVALSFDTRITSGTGPTGTELWTPRPPALAVTLDLPGDKDVSATSETGAGGVDKDTSGGRTRATVHLPSTEAVSITWSEALPADAVDALRANAEVYHVVRAGDGMLAATAFLFIEVTRGKAQTLSMALPQGALVNAVRGGGVGDWRSSDPRPDGTRVLTLYLDRDLAPASEPYRFEVDYELVVGRVPGDANPIEVPLVTVEGMHRQRGMVALVRPGGPDTELTMEPVSSDGLAGVGENQLPSWLRDQTQTKVTHTYKYAEPAPSGALEVKLVPFQRELARYDATVDTLFSLAEGVLRANANLEVLVKAGSLAELDIVLPPGINVLSASAPSLREHRVIEATDKTKRVLRLSFTREMEGSVKIDLGWEKVLAPGASDIQVPLVHVQGSVVEEGRIALEALTAVEVKPLKAASFTAIDLQDLPQKLTSKTSNPILLAYHYVYADPPAELVLGMQRHEDLAVQVAAIDRAAYETLWTKDGVVLTRARYLVRNRGKQFLRVLLPEGSEVWSAQQSGAPVKPAKGATADTVLIPLSSSAKPFEVELVFARQTEALGFAGSIEGTLPVPDLVATETRWVVYLPADVEWGEIETDMTIVERPDQIIDAQDTSLAQSDPNAGARAIRIEVPQRGRRMVLEKLLAHVSSPGLESVPTESDTGFVINYSGPGANVAGGALVFIGAIVFGLVLLRATSGRARVNVGVVLGMVLSAGAVVAGMVWLGGSPWLILPPAIVIAFMAAWRALAARRRAAETPVAA